MLLNVLIYVQVFGEISKKYVSFNVIWLLVLVSLCVFVCRFCSWFAYHLSNFQFRWTWEEWLDAAALPQLHPKPMFVQGALAKCLRLSYHQRLVEIIPAELQPFVPAAPLPVIKYGEQAAEDTPGLAISKKLAEAIQSRCTEDEALEILNEIDNAKTQQQLQPGGGPDEDGRFGKLSTHALREVLELLCFNLSKKNIEIHHIVLSLGN